MSNKKSNQAIIDFFYLFDVESCIKSLDDIFELSMENEEAKPTGYDFQIYRNLKELLQAIKPNRSIRMEETTYFKEHR